MFNLQELQIKVPYPGENISLDEKKQGFVGIKRDLVSKQLEFCLPKGFHDFPTDDFDALKKIFFRTFRTYKKFFDQKKQHADNKSFDGFLEHKGGYTLYGKDENIATYSKLNVFDSVLDAYDELQILSLQNRLSKSSEIDYAKIEKYLHRGIYLEDDTVFIDEMDLPKKIIDLDSPSLVEMFCYLFCEIKNALEEEVESYRAITLAFDFKEKYLTYSSSLFDRETFNETLAILKDKLDDIDRFTGYKDEDYWHFFNAVYTFLYGENEYEDSEDGTIWGLDNFSFVWEDLCFHFASRDQFKDHQILFADRFGKAITYNGFENHFYLQINNEYRRYLRPDLVVIDEELLEEDFLKILSKIFKVEDIELNFTQNKFKNLKLTSLSSNNMYLDIFAIYNKWVEKNPSVFKNPGKLNYRNVADQHRKAFIEELMKFFFSLKTQQLISRKPLVYDLLVIDYKYVAEELFQSQYLIDQRVHDIKKQLVYEMALQIGYETLATRSEFWIPTYYSDDTIFEDVDNLNSIIIKNGISVLKINFEYLQEIYLQ